MDNIKVERTCHFCNEKYLTDDKNRTTITRFEIGGKETKYDICSDCEQVLKDKYKDER